MYLTEEEYQLIMYMRQLSKEKQEEVLLELEKRLHKSQNDCSVK